MVASDIGSSHRERRLPEGVVDDLLAADRRRYALEALAANDGPLSVNDVAAYIRARETDVSLSAVEKEERQEVRDEFFQRHLPKLTATDVVEYDSVLGTVELVDGESFGDALEHD